MRVSMDPAGEEAPPPPYTAYQADPAMTPDYEAPEAVAGSSLPIRTSLRGGYTRSIPDQESEVSTLLSPAAYFEERRFQCDVASEELEFLEHNIHFDSSTTPTRLPFPRPSDGYLRRDVTGQDWATFVNYLFSNQQKRPNPNHLNSPEQRERIRSVIAEWNVGFFTPRLIRIIEHFEPLLNDGASSPRVPQASHYGNEKSRNLSQHQVTINRGPSNEFLTPGAAGPSQAGPSNLDSPRKLRHSVSKSSFSSSSSSSSDSSVDSIASKDFDHATLPEIQAIIASFRADPHKKNHLRKSVKELRAQLRSQHLPFSSSDPYSTKFSKDEKKKFKEQRKVLKKEIKAIIREAKDERKVERKLKKAARRQLRYESRQARRSEKRCHRERKRSSRDVGRSQGYGNEPPISPDPRHQGPHLQEQQPQPQPSSTPFPIIPQARAAYATTRSWSSERAAVVRTRSNDAAAFARHKADQTRQQTADIAAAAGSSARQAGLQARDTAWQAGRRASNTAMNAVARAQGTALGASSLVSGQADRASEIARRQVGGEGRERAAVAQRRADDAAAVLAGRELAGEQPGRDRARDAEGGEPVELRAQTTGRGEKAGVVGL